MNRRIMSAGVKKWVNRLMLSIPLMFREKMICDKDIHRKGAENFSAFSVFVTPSGFKPETF